MTRPTRSMLIHGDKGSDADLVVRVQRGDREALAALYHRYAADLFAVARRISGSSAAAEDVLHDLFLGLPELLHRYTDAGKLGGWLRQVTVRLALIALRRERRRSHVQIVERDLPVTPPPSILRVDFASAVDRLPDGLRTVFVLRQIEDLSHEEIADVLGISVGASRVRYLRALRRLRTLLEPYR